MDKTGFHGIDISTLQEQIKQGLVSAQDLVKRALQQIETFDGSFNAIRTLNQNAMSEAKELDRLFENNEIRGPLHGIPILLKDNIDTLGMPTTAGSEALKDRYAKKDAPLVQHLKTAGAIILGKTNLTELANFMSEAMPNGYSSLGGQVKHTWGDFDPLGSSTGSAVAISAGYVPVAFGTETCGSVISPAAVLGVVGFKPTTGHISKDGIIPISATQDTAGPIANHVKDCAFLYDVLTDASVLTDIEHLNPSTCRLGVIESSSDASYNQALETLKELGFPLKIIKAPKFEVPLMLDLLLCEFKLGMDATLSLNDIPIRSLEDLMKANQSLPEVRLRHGQSLVEKAVAFDTSQHQKIKRESLHASQNRLKRLYAYHDISLLVSPMTTGISAMAGYPSITIPIGVENDKPVPIVLNGLADDDALLFKVAYALEKAIGQAFIPPALRKLFN